MNKVINLTRLIRLLFNLSLRHNDLINALTFGDTFETVTHLAWFANSDHR